MRTRTALAAYRKELAGLVSSIQGSTSAGRLPLRCSRSSDLDLWSEDPGRYPGRRGVQHPEAPSMSWQQKVQSLPLIITCSAPVSRPSARCFGEGVEERPVVEPDSVLVGGVLGDERLQHLQGILVSVPPPQMPAQPLAVLAVDLPARLLASSARVLRANGLRCRRQGSRHPPAHSPR
jgi:hypothetical protein